MSRMLASRMGYEPERSTAFGSITGSYVLMGPLFTHPIRILVLQNGTNAAIQYSLDGVNTLITLQAGIHIILDITAARTNDPAGLTAPINWGVYVRQETGAPASGSAYASAIYGAGAESLG
jgi:hypothetical protein